MLLCVELKFDVLRVKENRANPFLHTQQAACERRRMKNNLFYEEDKYNLISCNRLSQLELYIFLLLLCFF
jgi:hypothetical protein